MKLTICKEKQFIPEFNGNRALPAVDQIVVKYRAPTVAIKNRCRANPQSKAIADSKGKITNMEIVIERDEITTLQEMLVSIHGASFEDDKGNVSSIVNAKDLLAAPLEFEPLLAEIIKHFDEELDSTEINEKN